MEVKAVPPIDRAGSIVHDGFLEPEACRKTLAAVDRYRSNTDLPEIHREARGRALSYSVIVGHQIRVGLPDIWVDSSSSLTELTGQGETKDCGDSTRLCR